MLDLADEQLILAKIEEILEHGYGRVEVLVQDKKITNVRWEKSIVAKDLVLRRREYRES